MMKRIAFFGISGHSRYPYSGAMHQSDGMPRSAGTKLENILELYDVTDNKGNMIHGEAPARIIESDRRRSCCISVKALVEAGWGADRISKELSRLFDLVVFSTANLIRPNTNPGCTAQILDTLNAEFIVIGMGLQESLPTKTESLHPRLVELLEVCNRKAKVFWVRGLETEGWLKSLGYDRAKAFGCPSMYVYPDNILGISAPDPFAVTSAVTGGYIHGRIPRSSVIIDLFKVFDAHYVMQEEIFYWKEQGLISADQEIYNDATGEVNLEVVNNILTEIHDEKMPFSSYRWFQDPNAWRMFASRFDFYLGDRLHGGIVALQVGVPSIIMAEDKRVSEIADFYNIPKISVREAEMMSLRDIVEEKLSPPNLEIFKETYFKRFHELKVAFGEAGIPLVVSANGTKQTMANPPPPHVIAKRKKRRIVRMLRSLLRRF